MVCLPKYETIGGIEHQQTRRGKDQPSKLKEEAKEKSRQHPSVHHDDINKRDPAMGQEDCEIFGEQNEKQPKVVALGHEQAVGNKLENQDTKLENKGTKWTVQGKCNVATRSNIRNTGGEDT
ncbi:hypothetical protein KEM54_001812 [Ascosphaera aggregata]|nr:hypothetical protein KEM54_001812 [Ascosphaera aggregata]